MSHATPPGQKKFPVHLLAIGLSFVVCLASACTVDTARPTPTRTRPPTLVLTAVPLGRTTNAVLPTPTVVLEGTMVAPTAAPAPVEALALAEVPPSGEAEPPAAIAEPASATSHTVEPGDTLLGIAMTFDVPMAAIQLRNNLGEATTVLLGEVLEIPSSQAWSGASPFWVVHEVASGETLSEIAADYGLELDDLQAANASLDPDHIAVGEAVVLPLGMPADLLAKAESPPADVAPPAEALPPSEPETLTASQAEPETMIAADDRTGRCGGWACRGGGRAHA